MVHRCVSVILAATAVSVQVVSAKIQGKSHAHVGVNKHKVQKGAKGALKKSDQLTMMQNDDNDEAAEEAVTPENTSTISGIHVFPLLFSTLVR